jgi:predicted nucleotide-binding protein (sugar kinase/HSP70/actin superfamily)
MSIFAKSKLYSYEHTDIKSIIECGKNFFDVRFTGEAILVAGGFFKNILHTIHGAINIGPFGCMPTRITEAVVTPCLSKQFMSEVTEHKHLAADISTLPFLSLETDGSPFSQLQETKIEAFCLQVERVYQKLNKKSQLSPIPFYRDALVVSDDPVSETKKGDLPEVIDKKEML